VNEKQLFGVLARAVGLLIFVDGFRFFWVACTQWIFPRNFEGSFFLELIAPNLTYGLLVMTVAVVLIRWPAWAIRLAWLDHWPTIGGAPDSN
jgi:hypothetical protein